MEDRFVRGIEEFNRQFFFEAHDTWEELWMETTGSHRLFYQGLIQTAVGFYHLSNRNFKGASSQLGKAVSKIEQYLPEFLGIDTERLVRSLRECKEDAEHLRDGLCEVFDDRKIPHIIMNRNERFTYGG
jgi:predicted metal-dependent hydrolase